MKKFPDQERAAIARGWAASGLPQDQYAARYGVTGRALRLWLARHAPSGPSLRQVEHILVEALEKLQAVLDAVRAAREERAAAGAGCEGVMQQAKAVLEELLQQEYRPEDARDPDSGAEVLPEAKCGSDDLVEPGGRTSTVRASPRSARFFDDFR